jgi:hypothetical protein
MERLDIQVASTNLKVSDLYSRWKRGLLEPSDFQRKLVWKRGHKIKLIETVLANYPFPEVYIANGEKKEVDGVPHSIQLIIDGQQRLTTIFNYINGQDIFVDKKIKLTPFKELIPAEQGYIMDYKISVRDLENVNREVMIRIFDRINQSSYTLTPMEKAHAVYLDSEFLLFSKQLVEEDFILSEEDVVKYIIPEDKRAAVYNFIQKECQIFSDVDNDRMYSLQYMMTLIATLVTGRYFGRNSGATTCLEKFNEEFPDADLLLDHLLEVIAFLSFLPEFELESIWLSKTNIFTLIVELFKMDVTQIQQAKFKDKLESVSNAHKNFLNGNKQLASRLDIEFFEASREGVNQLNRRETRAIYLQKIINECI